jgi:hypothetical protein
VAARPAVFTSQPQHSKHPSEPFLDLDYFLPILAIRDQRGEYRVWTANQL